MWTLIVILLILALLGALPGWNFHNYGYYPSVSLGTILVIILILWLLGVVR